jgi:hypothetical protein
MRLSRFAPGRFCRAAFAAAFLFALPAASLAQTTAIHDIMTALPNSPKLEQTVTVSGVVVGVMNTGAFYITTPDSGWNAKTGTAAEGIEILPGSVISSPSCALVGNLVSVTGVVQNGTAVNGAHTPNTQIQASGCAVQGTGAITKTVTLASAKAYVQDLAYTGMPAISGVSGSLTSSVFNAISPTGGTTDPTTGFVTSNGQFWVDIGQPTNGHLFKSAGLEADEFYPPPPAPPTGIPTWDGNPERLYVDTTTFGGVPLDVYAGSAVTCTPAKNLTTGAINGIGVIDYSLGYNRLLVFKTTTCVSDNAHAATITAIADPGTFHVGTMYLQQFTGNAPNLATRVTKAALAIINIFGAPDILSVQEVSDLATLQKIADAANAVPGSITNYKAYISPTTNDATNLSLGFLINDASVLYSTDYVVNSTDTFTKTDGTTIPLFERPPYVVETFLKRAGQNYQVEVINIHDTERAGIDDPVNGPNVWERRAQQAHALSVFEQAEQTRGQNVIIAGEFNAYSFSDGFADVTDVIDGLNPVAQGKVAQWEPTVTNPPMYNFVKSINVDNSTYNVIENGNARSIEHILCSTTVNGSQNGSLQDYIQGVTQPHWTTDYPAVDANDPTIPYGLASRDGFTSAFAIPPVPTTVSVTATSISFGNVYISQSATQNITFTNTSTFPSTVTVSGITITGTNPGDFSQTSTCTALTQGQSCTITVKFAPTAAGVRDATLTINSDSGKEPTITTSLSGTGVNTTATLTPATATFVSTEVGAVSVAQTFTFTNTTPPAETMGQVSVTGDYAITANTCTGSIAGSGTCSVTVTFHPKATGTRTGTLTIANSSSANPMLTAALTATGLDTTATLKPATLTYPLTADGTPSVAQSVTWMNTSLVALTINSVVATGDFSVASTTCSGAIAAGASCTASVIFTPTVAGPRTGTLTVSSTSTANGTLVTTLTGTGAPNIGATPSSLNFGNSDIGLQTKPMSFTVTNYSNHAISVGAFTVIGDFAATGNCPASLAAHADCTVQVTFKPTALGARNGAVTIPTGDVTSPLLTVALTGNGVDFAIAVGPNSGGVEAGLDFNTKGTVTPLSGFTGTLKVTCSPDPKEGGSTCDPGGDKVLGAATTFGIDVTTTAQYKIIGYASIAGFASLMLLGLLRRSRRTMRFTALAMLLLVLGAANLGCTGKLPDRNPDPTYPGTYTYMVTATDGFLTHSATFSLAVRINNHQ